MDEVLMTVILCWMEPKQNKWVWMVTRTSCRSPNSKQWQRTVRRWSKWAVLDQSLTLTHHVDCFYKKIPTTFCAVQTERNPNPRPGHVHLLQWGSFVSKDSLLLPLCTTLQTCSSASECVTFTHCTCFYPHVSLIFMEWHGHVVMSWLSLHMQPKDTFLPFVHKK